MKLTFALPSSAAYTHHQHNTAAVESTTDLLLPPVRCALV